MKNPRLGCLTGSGILAALITLLVTVGIGLVRGGMMFSPGELNAQAGIQRLGGVFSHAETGGRCAACHPAFWENDVMADRCLICHQEVARTEKDFHTVMLAQSQELACRRCHPDHRGPQVSMIDFNLHSFPHDEIGFSLEAHQGKSDGSPFACSDCHGEGVSSFDQETCLTCHLELDSTYLQEHQDDFGSNCLACHDGVDSYGERFDHSLGAFPLKGSHASLRCSDCHSGARSLADLESAPQDCQACHAQDDAHNGEFGSDCAACHNSINWEEADFDHSLSAFPLTGAHVDIECTDCHQEGVYAGTPQECIDCHAKDDAHDGEFGEDCAACHATSDWEEAEFDHSLAAFSLTGAHVQVECTDCHMDGIYAGTPQECAGCHEDPAYHQGLFETGCDACHTTEAWLPATYDQPHTFPYDHGEEGRSDCQVCHPDSLSVYTCYECHEHSPADVENEHREEGILNFQDCTRCHPTGREEEGEREGEDD